MSPADYREALYSTWMTGQPWGMQLINCNSDDDDNAADDDDVTLDNQVCTNRQETKVGFTT